MEAGPATQGNYGDGCQRPVNAFGGTKTDVSPAPCDQPIPSAPGNSPNLALRLQVLGIISGILGGTRPELEGIREGLRRHVVEHPGDPETALLHHLLDRGNFAATRREMDVGPAKRPPAVRTAPSPWLLGPETSN